MLYWVGKVVSYSHWSPFIVFNLEYDLYSFGEYKQTDECVHEEYVC